MRVIEYDRAAAVAYAQRWAFRRNPAYYNFDDIGGDCTNFASQCLYAGTGVMNFTPTFGWYYFDANHKAPAWTGVEFFYNFLTRNETTPGPFGVSAQPGIILPGDFVQLKLTSDSFSHTPIIVEITGEPTPENILVAAHSNDADYRPLSTYDYQDIRFIHVLGAYNPQTI